MARGKAVAVAAKVPANCSVENIPFIHLCNLLEDIEKTKNAAKRGARVEAMVKAFFSQFSSGDIHEIYRLLIPEVVVFCA